MDKQTCIDRIIYYNELVTGRPARPRNIRYWNSLYIDQLVQILEKWKGIYFEERNGGKDVKSPIT